VRPEGQAPGPDQRFPKALRLRKRREFLRVQEGGQKVHADPLLALVQPNAQGRTRLGLTISSKVGNAVERARLRRLLRELFRKRRAQWPTGLDVVLVARSAANAAPFATLSAAFDVLERRLPRLTFPGPRRPGRTTRTP
jgi:ribonuclease P protein component